MRDCNQLTSGVSSFNWPRQVGDILMRKECSGISCIPLVGNPLKFLPKPVDNKFYTLDNFFVELEVSRRNPHQNHLHLEQDAPK